MEKYKIYDGKTIKIMSCRTCNKACKFCYLNYNGDFDSVQLYNFIKINKDKYKIKINGSEPLMKEGFLKSFKLAGETMVLTNGLVFKII